MHHQQHHHCPPHHAGGYPQDNFGPPQGGYPQDNFGPPQGRYPQDNFGPPLGGYPQDNFRPPQGGYPQDNFGPPQGGYPQDNFGPPQGGYPQDNFVPPQGGFQPPKQVPSRLRISGIEVTGMPAGSKINKTDPYVVVIHDGDRNQTEVAKNAGSTASFNSVFTYQCRSKKIDLEVYDKGLRGDTKLATGVLYLNDTFSHDGWVPLEALAKNCDTPKVRLSIAPEFY